MDGRVIEQNTGNPSHLAFGMSAKDKNQPWFGQIQIDGGKGDSRYLQQSDRILQNSVDLPPYFPDTPALSSSLDDSLR